MRKLAEFAFPLLVGVALTGNADQTIKECYYCYYTNNASSAVGTVTYVEGGPMTLKDGTQIPYSGVKLSNGKSQVFEAHPERGWKVEGWYRIPWDRGFGSFSDKNGTKLAGAVNTYTWQADATSGDYILSVFFEPISYRLSFDWTGVGSLTKNYLESFTLPVAEQMGYAFTGWTVNSVVYDVKTAYTGESFGITTDNQEVKLTPNWSEKSYDIDSAGENCTVAVNTSSATYTQQITITVTPPAEEPGVTFAPGKLCVYSGTDESGSVICQRELASEMTFKMSENAGGQYSEHIFVKATYVRTENPKHWLTIHPNGGRYKGNPDNQTLTTQLVEGGTSLNQLDISVNPNGAEFRGYFDAASDGKPVYDKDGKGVLGPYWDASGQFTGKQDLDVWAYWGDPPDSYEVAFASTPAEAGVVQVDYDGRQVVSNDFSLAVVEGRDFEMTAMPTNAGYSFSCWTNSLGMATNDNPWTLAVDGVVTNVAVFTGNVYKVKFNMMDCDWNEYEGTVKPASKSVTYGQTYGELPVPTLDDESVKFDCWVDEDGNRISADSQVLITAKAELYLQVSPREPYTILYDSGLGANVEKAYRDLPHRLKANSYVRTGYTFANWTNAAGVAYAGGATVTNLAAAGETATLYAVWSNNVYSVDFDGNDATGGAMEPQAFTYDVAAKLSANGFTKAGMEFAGWSTNGVTDVVYTNGEEVVNLTAEPNGDFKLTAVWREKPFVDYSKAMHCDNLVWTAEGGTKSCWTTNYSENAGVKDDGSPSGSEVKGTVLSGQTSDLLVATVTEPGTLTFGFGIGPDYDACCVLSVLRKKEGSEKTLISYDGDGYGGGIYTFDTENPITLTQEDVPCELCFFAANGSDGELIVRLDQVKWTPERTAPQQGEAVPATGVSVTDGKFVLSVPGDSGVNYGVWTNANLLVPVESWGFMTNHVGEGTPFSFEMPVLPELPQLFFSTFKVK